MGLVSNAQNASRRMKNRPAVKTGAAATKETDNFLAKFPIEMREKILKQAVRAASRAVATEARKNLNRVGPPGDGAKNAHVGRSKKTRTREGWSKKIRDKRSGNKDMYEGMAVKVKQYRGGRVILGMTGPRSGTGNQSWILEHGGTIKLWGKGTYRLPPRPFLRPAATNTMPQQRKAMEDKMRKEWKKL